MIQFPVFSGFWRRVGGGGGADSVGSIRKVLTLCIVLDVVNDDRTVRGTTTWYNSGATYGALHHRTYITYPWTLMPPCLESS